MGLLPVLVYYSSVVWSKNGRVLAEFKNRSFRRDLAPVVAECLSQVPPLHSRFTLTTKRRIFCCLMEDGFTYSCIVDEALGKADAFMFLESVRDEFASLLKSRGVTLAAAAAATDPTLMASIAKEFTSTMRVLTLPLIGVPQKEIDSLRASAIGSNGHFREDLDDDANAAPSTSSMTHPLYSSSERSDGAPELSRSGSKALGRLLSIKSKRASQQQQRINYERHQTNEDRLEVVVVDTNGVTARNDGSGSGSGDGATSTATTAAAAAAAAASSDGDLYPHSKSFSVREAENKWWRNLKIVLVLDVLICVLLFVVWLGVCRGFDCVS